MRTVGLILTTVMLGVASAAWWRDFGPTESLNSLPEANPSTALIDHTATEPAEVVSLDSGSSTPVKREIATPDSGPKDRVAPPESEPQALGESPLSETSRQPAIPVSEPTKNHQTPAAASAEQPQPALDQSPDVQTLRAPTLALAATQQPPPAPPATVSSSLEPPTVEISTEQPKPIVESRPEARVFDEGVFEVPRIAAELVSERRAATVYFELDETDLLPEAQTTLSILVDDLQQANAILRIQIDGHCDDTGSHDYNQGLSEERAEVVLAFLKQRGVTAPDQVLRGFGERVRAVPGIDSGSRALNRRAHIRIDWVRRRELDVSAGSAPAQ